MAEIHQFLSISALLFLVSFAIAVLSERFERKKHPAGKKASRDTMLELLAVWAWILALKKWVYYMQLDGVLQTKYTIWWIDKNDFSYLFIVLFIALIMILRGIKKKLTFSAIRRGILYIFDTIGGFGFFIIVFIVVIILTGFYTSLSSLGVFSFWPKLLLSLKLICQGKYFGLFTAFALAYYIANAHQLFKTSKKGKAKGKVFGVPLLLLGIGIFIYLTIPSRPSAMWHKFYSQLRDAEIHQEESAFADLLDAADTIKDGVKKYRALGEIAAVMNKTGKIRQGKEVLQQAVNEIHRLEDRSLKFRAFRYLAFILKDSGDNSGAGRMYKSAIWTALGFKDIGKRVDALKTIVFDTTRFGDIKWAKDIYLAAVDAADYLDKDSLKVKIYQDVLETISQATGIEWAEPVYRKIIAKVDELVNQLAIYKEIALAIANTGDILWATTIAQKIPDIKTKERTLAEIREIREKIENK